MASVKTDNHNPAAKLALRRYFLDKYHADDPPDVLDCCQGGGVMWRELRKTHAVKSYWGLDLKPKPGRLKLDSVRVLQQPGWPQNVVDVDTYGSPWKHWAAILANATRPTTVFLTMGQLTTGTVGHVADYCLESIGLGRIKRLLPIAFHVKLGPYLLNYCLATSCVAGKIIVEAVEAVSDGPANARYIGVRLEPVNANGPELSPPSRSTRPRRTKKESASV